MDAVGFGIIMPVLPQLVMEVGRIDLPRAIEVGAWIGLVMAVATFLASPVLGNLSDHFGRRRILLLALGGLAVDYVLLDHRDLAVAVRGAGIVGHFGGSYAAAQAAIADITAPEERARNFGFVGAAFGVGFVAGPRSAVSWRDRPARAVRCRRRDPCRGEYALWLFHLSRNATPRTAPDVRLAACQPASARGERCARPEWTASPECSCCGRSPASSIR